MARKLIGVAVLLVATILILDLAFSDVASAGYICGKVFWNEAEHDSGATDITMWAQSVHDPVPHMTSTNCCGEYAFTGLTVTWTYKVWGLFGCITADPCQISGSECWEMVWTDTLEGTANETGVDFDLGIDCANVQDPCEDPCPE